MLSCQDIEENRCFSNGGTNLHIHPIAQGRPEDNQVEFLQGPHGIVNPPKNLVLNNIRRFTMEHIGAANGLHPCSVLYCFGQYRNVTTATVIYIVNKEHLVKGLIPGDNK